MKFVVCAHHTRLEQAQRLAALLDAHLLLMTVTTALTGIIAVRLNGLPANPAG